MINVLNLLGVNDQNRIEVLLNKGTPRESDLNIMGNLSLMKSLNPSDMKIQEVMLGGRIASGPHIDKPDVIINSICDPELNMNMLNNILNNINVFKVNVINHPAKVLQCNRKDIYGSLKDSKRFFIPKTIKITPSYLSDIIHLIKNEIITLPFIFREIGSDRRKSALLVKSLDDIHDLERFAFDGQDYYITEFVDHISPDGLYRTYRMVVIEGKCYPKNILVSNDWIMHTGIENALMTLNKSLQEEDILFIKEGREHFTQLANEIYNKVDLDIFGVDFTIDKSDQLVVLDVNVCMNFIDRIGSVQPLEYQKKRNEEMKNAILDMIRNKID